MSVDARSWPLVEVVDPSMTRGLYVGWFQRDTRTDRWYWVHAKHIESGPVSTMAHQVMAERRYIGKSPELAIMDAKGGRHRVDIEENEDWFQRFRKFGLDYIPNDEPATLEELDEWLKPKWDPLLGQSLPKLLITERVAQMEQGPLWAFQRFQWDPMMTHKQLYSQPGKDYVDCAKYLANQKAVARVRLSGPAMKTKAFQRQAKRAMSYGFAKTSSRSTIWSPPRFR